MARVHRPPPPVPTVEPEEIDDNYGVWAEDEFDEFDPGEIYENTEDPKGEDDSDYEHPDEPDPPARSAVRPLPTPAAPAIPAIPPRPGFRPVPSPASLRPEPRVSRISPRASPLPQPQVEDDEETYEIIDTPQTPIDDGEVYEEVDEKPVLLKPNNAFSRPLPKPGGAGLKAHPSIPLPAFQMKEVPKKPIKGAVSPNMPRRDMPLPPPVKPSQPGRVPPFQRPSPQPSPPPPPPEPEMDDMYTGTDDFYAGAEGDSSPPPQPFRGGLAKNAIKPLPRPPSECDDDEGEVDEYYTEVPETKPFGRKASADRPIPPLPQPQPASREPTSLSSSGRFPVEKLQAELARMAEANKKPREPEETADVPSDNKFQTARNMLKPVNKFGSQITLDKPVNRVESLNTPEKQRLPTVKRAESDNIKPFDKPGNRKVSKISEMTNNYESDENEPEKPGISLSPMFPRKDASGNRNTQPVATSKPTRPVPSKVAVPKPETRETLAPPVPRVSPFRNVGDEVNPRETTPNTRSTPNDKRALPKPPNNELEGLYSYGWYYSTIERSSAESKILEMKQDGAFLVRKSKRGGESNPYTLTLLYSGFIYNLHIRRRPDQKYALGSEKPDEHVFNSVGDLISFHRNNPIEVVGDARKNATPGKVFLKASPNK